jgi:hypothetical protein
MAATKTSTQTPSTSSPATDLAALIAQQKQLAAAIKEARASQPKVDRLAREIANQAADTPKWFTPVLAMRVQRRVKLGQDQDVAVAEALAQVRDRLLAALAAESTEQGE